MKSREQGAGEKNEQAVWMLYRLEGREGSGEGEEAEMNEVLDKFGLR